MIPSAFIFLKAFPLTNNGKLDRQALPAPDRAENSLIENYVAARDELEAELVQIWEEVLSVKPLGVRDNFFEIGGHSLLAVRLRAQIEKALGDTVPISILFQHPTIEELAGYLRSKVQPPVWSPVVAIQSEGSRPPFFCVHPAGGNVYCYVELARLLGEDQPFYAFQAGGWMENQRRSPAIEEMAGMSSRSYAKGSAGRSIFPRRMVNGRHRQLLRLPANYISRTRRSHCWRFLIPLAPGDLVVNAPGSASLLAGSFNTWIFMRTNSRRSGETCYNSIPTTV